jgi:hypothetical protein
VGHKQNGALGGHGFDLMKVKVFFAVGDRSYSGAQGISS